MPPFFPQINSLKRERARLLRGWLVRPFKPFSLEQLASLGTILGTVVSLFALIQSRTWLVITSGIFAVLSIVAGLYGRSARLALGAASIVIEGHSIDSLNIANLRRRVNRTFVVQEAHDSVRILGEDMEVTWKYSGYCKTDRESAIEFSVDTDANLPFDQLDCVAFDLENDPHMSHKIRPALVSTEGASKKLAVPFLNPLRADQPFAVVLKCSLPKCLKPGFGYYSSTLSFAQDRVRQSSVKITFVGPPPRWMRAYECTLDRPVELVKSLVPAHHDPSNSEYLDVIEDRQAQSARIYAFWRDSVGS